MRFAKTVIPDPVVVRVPRDEEIQVSKKHYHVMCTNEENIHKTLTNSGILFHEVNL